MIDPGRFTYSEEPPNLRRWFRGTAAHNTVCVDGLDQTPYRRGRPDGPVAEGRFLGRASTDRARRARRRGAQPGLRGHPPRRITFVDGSLLADRGPPAGERAHRYDLRFHLAPGRTARPASTASTVLAPGLALVIAGADTLRLERGWIAPRYGEPARGAGRQRRRRGREATFVSVLVPHGAVPRSLA